MSDLETQVKDLIVTVTNTDEVLAEPDLDLFEAGLLDSLAVVELLVSVGDLLGTSFAPTEVDREEFNTVNAIVAFAKEHA